MDPTNDSDSTREEDAGTEKSVDAETTLYEVLDQFSEALAIVETVARALHSAENDRECGNVGPEIATLRHAVEALRAVHEEFDLAIAKVSP
jgi:hypothetical protein